MQGTWQEQWERVQIGLRRVEEIYKGRPETAGSPEAVYDLYAFFMNALHLRDWLANDPHVPADWGKVTAAMRGSDPLRICEDFAIATKHLKVDRPQIDANTRTLRQDVAVGGGQWASHAWRIAADNVQYDALDLAGDILRAWEVFLEAEDLH